jgi:hypothetical protein
MADTGIPARKVKITRIWLVDCAVCGEAVEPDSLDGLSGGFRSARAASAAKQNHLDEHARGQWG